MKKLAYILAAAWLTTLTLTTYAQGGGAKMETKKGGSAEAGNHKVEMKGSKGGGMKIDKQGLKMQGKNGGKVEITGKKKK
jgi:hypothetical protein